jgi:hypothetical protein
MADTRRRSSTRGHDVSTPARVCVARDVTHRSHPRSPLTLPPLSHYAPLQCYRSPRHALHHHHLALLAPSCAELLWHLRLPVHCSAWQEKARHGRISPFVASTLLERHLALRLVMASQSQCLPLFPHVHFVVPLPHWCLSHERSWRYHPSRLECTSTPSVISHARHGHKL